MPDNPAAPSAAGTPAPAAQQATDAPDLASQLASERAAREASEQRFRELQTREGRLRNELGAYRNRLREMEDRFTAADNDGTDPTQVAGTGATGYGQPSSPPYTPSSYAYGYQAQNDPMSLYRQNDSLRDFQWEHSDELRQVDPATKKSLWEEVKSVVNDPSRVGEFISYRTVPHSLTGQPVVEPDVARTYKAALREIKLRKLEAAHAASQPPSSNPNQAVISGQGAASTEPAIDLSQASWKDMSDKGLVQPSTTDPPSFARGSRPLFPGR